MASESTPLQSALVLLFPQVEPVVGEWRARYDPSASVGATAHVTLLVPFIAPPMLTPDLVEDLAVFFGGYPSFDVKFAGVCAFRDTLYLAPEPQTPIDAIIAGLAARYPATRPYGGAIPVAQIVPHLTVAHLTDRSRLDKVARQFCRYSVGRLPIDAAVREATLIAQDNDGVYRVRAVLPLSAG